MVSRAVPNIKSDRPAETREFFVDLLGFEVAMDLGWVVTVASPTNRSAQVTIIGNDDPAAPGISVGVADVDAVHARAVERASRSPTRSATRSGESGASCSESRAARSSTSSPPLGVKLGGLRPRSLSSSRQLRVFATSLFVSHARRAVAIP